MTNFEKAKEAYENLSGTYSYFFRAREHYVYDDGSQDVLEFRYFCLQFSRSFTYTFSIDGDPCGDEIEFIDWPEDTFSVGQLNAISDFAKAFNELREDKEATMEFVKWLEEHKMEGKS